MAVYIVVYLPPQLHTLPPVASVSATTGDALPPAPLPTPVASVSATTGDALPPAPLPTQVASGSATTGDALAPTIGLGSTSATIHVGGKLAPTVSTTTTPNRMSQKKYVHSYFKKHPNISKQQD